MKLPLTALRAFATVHAQGGVRAAARELGITHSSVSRHLAELEAWLGIDLTTGSAGRAGIAFTPQGDLLARSTLSGLAEIERAVASLRESRSTRSVTVSAAPSFATRWLLPRLPKLERSHPQIELSVVVDQKIDTLESGRIDVAIRMGRGPWPDVRCEPLMDDVLYPVASAALFESAGRPRTPADLDGMRLLHDRDPSASWETWRQAHGPATLDVLAGPRFASSDLVLRAAMQGHGVALARHRLACDDVAGGALVRLFEDLAVPLRAAYWIVLPKHGRVRNSTAAVVEWLKDQAARDGPLS
jgi:LysR family transcriptional regulator, glycine cleavage system transcriptional activator